jgi:hypothetical protein
MAIAREVLAAEMSVAKDSGEITPLRLLGEWIDDPTEERFAWISALIFDERQPSPDPDPNGVVSWALRTATSSVGNYEAGWALATVCHAAMSAGFDVEALREIANRELMSRLRYGPLRYLDR